MESKFVIRNGELIKKEEANVSVYNKSLFFDFSVYSNIKVVGGKMFAPDIEIEKLFESGELIGIKHPFEKEKVMEWARFLIKENNLKDALIRLLLIGPEKDAEPLLFMFPVGLTFYPNRLYNSGAKLVTYEGERFMPASKTKNLLMSYIAYREAEKNNAIDALLIDRDGNVTEGTRSSFFAVKDGILIAPPKEKALEGVTRKIILEIAGKLMKVTEEDIPFDKIKDYDECFITGTTLKVMPITKIDDTVIGKKAGEKTKQLQKIFKEHTDRLFV